MRQKAGFFRMGGVYHAPAPDSQGFRKLLGFLFGVFTGIDLLFAVLGGCSLHADRAFYASATAERRTIFFVKPALCLRLRENA